MAFSLAEGEMLSLLVHRINQTHEQQQMVPETIHTTRGGIKILEVRLLQGC